jgi:16S rRNA (cytidine1402-2'-O)-methyltransferase
LETIQAGSLYVVSTPIGNLGDISYRAVHILKSVHLIAAEDTRTSGVLLRHYDITTRTQPFHSYNQRAQAPRLVERMKQGESIALISDAGTPGISDPAYALVTACVDADIPVIPVPGASALLAALVTSGLPVNRFVFEGFLPMKKGRQTRIRELAQEPRTIVFYESPHRIRKTVNELYAALGDRNCVMARELTKKFEEFFRGPLSSLSDRLADKDVKGEIVLLVAGMSSGKSNRADRDDSD